MDFNQYLQSQNPQGAMAGAMAGPAGGSYGSLALQTLQQAQRQQQAPAAPQIPGGPSLPQPGPGGGGYAGPQSQLMQQGLPPQYQGAGQRDPRFQMNPQLMQDPEYQEGYRLGMMLAQLSKQMGG